MADQPIKRTDGIRKRDISHDVSKKHARVASLASVRTEEKNSAINGEEHALRQRTSFMNESAERSSAEPEVSGQVREEPYQEIAGVTSSARFWGAAKRTRGRPMAWGIGGALALVFVLVILLSTVFARLTIVIKPRREKLALADIVAAFDVSVARTLVAEKVVPAEKLEFARAEKEEFSATGKKQIEDRARGTVKIYNSFSSSPQNLVATTRFLSESGALFRLASTVIIPGAKIEQGKIVPQYREAELIADKAGEKENMNGSVTLKVPGFQGSPKYDAFSAVAESGFQGGFRGQATVVTAEDLKKAEEEVTKRAYNALKQEIARKISPDFKLIDSLQEVRIMAIDAPKEGARQDRFTVAARAAGRVLLFREQDVLDLLNQTLLKDDKTKTLVPGSAAIAYQIRTVEYEKGRAEIFLKGELTTKAVLAADELARRAQGEKEGSLVDFLKSRSEIASFRLSFFPPWITTAPSTPQKIHIVVEE